MKKEEQKPNKPQKPQLNTAVVNGSFYWVKPFNDSEFEPAKARLDYRDEICFAFTDGSTMSIDAVWEVEPLNCRQPPVSGSVPLQTKLEMFYEFLYERDIAKQLGVGIDTIVKHFIDEKLSSNDCYMPAVTPSLHSEPKTKDDMLLEILAPLGAEIPDPTGEYAHLFAYLYDKISPLLSNET